MAVQTLYIIYNADASLMGKLKYGYRKLSASKGAEPACAACDITHGGLSLTEAPAWTQVKKEIEAKAGAKVVQWHRDEVSAELRAFVQRTGLRYPAVVLAKNDSDFETVVNSSELARCAGDPKALFEALKTRGIIKEQAAL